MAAKTKEKPTAQSVTYAGMERPWWIRAHHYKDHEEGIRIARALIGDEKVAAQSKAQERVLKAAQKAGLEPRNFVVTTLTPDCQVGNAILLDQPGGKTVARYRWSVGLSGAAPKVTLFKRTAVKGGYEFREVK